MVGASIAYNLAAKGVDGILVVERAKAGGGSTSSSLGGFRAQFSTELSVSLSMRSIGIIERFEELTGYDPLISRDGYVFVASTERSYERLEKDQRFQRSMGVHVDLVGGRELQELYPFYRFDHMIGGTICLTDGHASTMAVLQGYLTASKRMGVQISEGTEVTSVKKGRDGYVVSTSRGTVATHAVVVAAGAYSGVVGKRASVQIPIEPYPRKVLVTNSFSDGIPEKIPLIIDVDTTFAFGREGRGLIFATNPTTDPSFDLVFPPTYDSEVMLLAVDRVPAAGLSSLSRAVEGLYEISPDANPIVGEIPGNPGLYCCAGFAGHGFMHAPAIGEVFAELFTKGKTSLDITSFGIERFGEGKADRERRIV